MKNRGVEVRVAERLVSKCIGSAIVANTEGSTLEEINVGVLVLVFLDSGILCRIHIFQHRRWYLISRAIASNGFI